MQVFSALLALSLLVAMPSCQNTIRHQSGRNAEDFKPFITAAGEPAILTATWPNRQSPGQFEVMRLGTDNHYQAWPTETGDSLQGFHPHGLSVVQDSSAPGWEGRDLVYAVSGTEGKIRVFELLDGKVRPLGTLGGDTAPKLKGLNAVTALPNGVVFATQFGPSWSVSARELNWTGVTGKTDAVVRFIPDFRKGSGAGSWARADTSWGGANGIAYLADQRMLLVAGFSKKMLHMVPVDPESGELDWPQHRSLALPGCPDNLITTTDGTCIANCVPSSVGALLRLGLEKVLPPLPYLFRPAQAVEVQPDPSRLIHSTPIPRQITQPSTTWRTGSDFYTCRIYLPDVFQWRKPQPAKTLQ